jgi:transposase
LNSKQLYKEMLGLQGSWYIKSVTLSKEIKQVTVEVALRKGLVWADPTNRTARAHINGWTERQWRHLDTCQFKTIIKARVPQLKYSDGTVKELPVPWADRYARVSLSMEAFVVELLQACPNIKSVCSLTDLSWKTVDTIMKKAVERGLTRRAQVPMEHLGLDEKSIEKGHSYASILTDVSGSRVLNLVRGRTQEAAQELLETTLSQEQRASVQAVAMDMWPAYMGAVRETLPKASIVHDKFHVVKYLNESVDQVRRREHRAMSAAGFSPLVGTKYSWMRNFKDKRSSEAVEFRALHQMNLKTSRAWTIKETFAHFWTYHSISAASSFFTEWSNNAMRSKLEPVKKVVKMLRRHLDGLLNYTRYHITNATAEGFNSVIQLIKTNARGFRSFESYRARILFHCGKLDLCI